jgi:ribA/ribD-fused uncharacterized protein
MKLPAPPTSFLRAEDLPDPDAFTQFHPFLNGVFSQWHITPFVIEDMTFNTAEQWMMANKAVLFGDVARARAIMATQDPSEQKRHGQLVAGFDTEVWDQHKIGIVVHGTTEKFRQNRGAARQLKATSGAMLVEANPRDWIWGCGLAIDDPDIATPASWRGSNLLGRVLTRVRDVGMESA